MESPSVLKHRFRASVVEMNARGLRHASKFLCEQLVGLAPADTAPCDGLAGNDRDGGGGDGSRHAFSGSGTAGCSLLTPLPSPMGSPHHLRHGHNHATVTGAGVHVSSSGGSGAGTAAPTATPAPAPAAESSLSTLSPEDYDQAMLAQSLMATGEYQRCAHILRRRGTLPPLLLFMSTYSLYVAGEKLREQQAHEKRSDGVSGSLNEATAKVCLD